MAKTIDTLVQDVYDYLEGYNAVSPEACKDLAYSFQQVLTEKLQKYRTPSLSMSSIGKPVRKLKLDIENPIKPNGKARLKFLYGDLLETLLLWLAKQAGHTVEKQQEKVLVDEVPGSIDAIIDGVLVDCKSCSPQSFKKFVNGTLPMQDPFGYMSQIAGYEDFIKANRVAFFAVDKVSGELAVYEPDIDIDLPNPHKVIQKAKEGLAKDLDSLPKCYEDVPAGKKGNRKLAPGCKYCPHRSRCWKNLRVFQYANGLEYFTKVAVEPSSKIKEIKKDEQD